MNQAQVEQLYEEFHTPHHVKQHCLQVALVGEFLAKALNEAGKKVETEWVWYGGLLHDFMRVVDFKQLPEDLGSEEDQWVWKKLRETYKGQHHGKVGATILRERKEEPLADIIARHQTALIGTPDGPNSWESKLVFYADKRVRHDEIVSLTERLKEGWERHFQGRPMTPQEVAIETAVYALEKEIFESLAITPEDVTKMLA